VYRAPVRGYHHLFVAEFIWIAVVLKIPVVALLWLCWYAVKEVPEPAGEQSSDDGGGAGHPDGPRRPRNPRRGDHASAPQPPARVRALAKRSDSVPRA
jgi:hypothetical protein